MRTLNPEINEISLWLKANNLYLNIKKTHFMIFSSKNKPHPNMNINIDGEIINEKSRTKFLGVIIDNKLSWKDHILYISGKLARGTGVILKTRKYLMKETLISLYYCFVYPYLIYCSHVWGLACKTYMNTLFLLPKRLIRTRYVDGTPTYEVTPVTIRYICLPHHGPTSQYHGHEWMTHILFVHCQSAAPFLR